MSGDSDRGGDYSDRALPAKAHERAAQTIWLRPPPVTSPKSTGEEPNTIGGAHGERLGPLPLRPWGFALEARGRWHCVVAAEGTTGQPPRSRRLGGDLGEFRSGVAVGPQRGAWVCGRVRRSNPLGGRRRLGRLGVAARADLLNFSEPWCDHRQ